MDIGMPIGLNTGWLSTTLRSNRQKGVDTTYLWMLGSQESHKSSKRLANPLSTPVSLTASSQWIRPRPYLTRSTQNCDTTWCTAERYHKQSSRGDTKLASQ